MFETSSNLTQTPGLLPGVSQHMAALESPPRDAPFQSELHRFLDRVVCDGRFLGEVCTDPERVAQELGLELSADAAEQLKARRLQDHLADLYATRFNAAAIGPAIIIIVAAIVIIIAIAIVRYSRSELSGGVITDLSPHRDLKL